MARKKGRGSEPTKIEQGGPSTRILRFQLGNANDRIEDLEAKVQSLKAQLGESPDELLVAIAKALSESRLAADARQAHRYDESGVRQYSEGQPIPGQTTENQRHADRQLRRRLNRAINDYQDAKESNWPKPPPLVRCRNTECPRSEKRIPAWDQDGANEHCRKCGSRLTT